MAKLKLSKHELHEQQEQLKLYQKLLPSLDLKRRQLMLEVQKAQDDYSAAQAAVDDLETRIGEELPMLADEEFRLEGLVQLKSYKVIEQNIVGVKLPFLDSIDCIVADYSRLATPPWVDNLVQRLKDAAEQRIRAEIAGQRLSILSLAVRRIKQRVNLFDKILIPTAKQNIQKIRIFLGDAERASVITSKLAKKKQQQRRDAEAALEEAL
ncbi:V-type ATP synthase subunit D [Methylobacter sp. S3L5C]|uniref:V-type ATP synthase subunit D n=1 Tax=Methylobacter sp. S3L5C TaxID=2839024 RepID=UPI001FAE3E21|nr:V-type ATP synthase subunit D [Methylobacter sp. S3L5C]UOA09821.1 V-type ATP synthase subunit D [Methylobacter sp. S3L5C]